MQAGTNTDTHDLLELLGNRDWPAGSGPNAVQGLLLKGLDG